MDRVIEKLVEVPVERVIETTVEVPVEKIVTKTVEVPVEKIVEVSSTADQAVINQLREEVAHLLQEYAALKASSEAKNEVKYDKNWINTQLSAKSDLDIGLTGSATFGTTWPMNPARGDLFLKVDVKPNRLYKWNNRKWIEIDKIRVDDTLVHDENYIDYLIQEVKKGWREFDDLSDAEKSQVIARIRANKSSG